MTYKKIYRNAFDYDFKVKKNNRLFKKLRLSMFLDNIEQTVYKLSL